MTSELPISTIVYASDDQINYCFQKLVSAGLISSFAFIRHDSDNKKEHCHVFCVPSRRVDLDNLAFIPSADNSSINAVKPFRRSKFGDWFLYAIHDKWYCSAKGLKGKHEYSLSDVYFSDEDLRIDASDALASSFDFYASPIDKMLNIYFDGGSFIDAMRALRIPYGAMGSFLRAWKDVSDTINESEKK